MDVTKGAGSGCCSQAAAPNTSSDNERSSRCCDDNAVPSDPYDKYYRTKLVCATLAF